MVKRKINVKLKWNFNETKVFFVNNGVPLVDSFVLKDIYLVKNEIDVLSNNNLEILSSCLVIREIDGEDNSLQLIYKNKKYDDRNNEINSYEYSCPIVELDKTYELLKKIGYKEIFRYEQECLRYANDKINILLKYLPELGVFAEIEDNNKSIEEIINDVNSLSIPYYENNYFIKVSSLMLDKVKKQRG